MPDSAINSLLEFENQVYRVSRSTHRPFYTVAAFVTQHRDDPRFMRENFATVIEQAMPAYDNWRLNRKE
ncbi:MAG: hypothetical protein OQK54_00705 [Gammaproteobacteria bacterium]|nr:hypothetical protein [Gammaproteobacteria bacterium]